MYVIQNIGVIKEEGEGGDIDKMKRYYCFECDKIIHNPHKHSIYFMRVMISKKYCPFCHKKVYKKKVNKHGDVIL